MDFRSFNLNPCIYEGIPSHFIAATEIQAQAIPSILEGKDVLGLAQTGTGKTAAFVLPILHRLMDGPRGKPRALIIAPTRELAEQICDCIGELGAKTGLRTTTIYGGVGMKPQVERLRRGVDIIVACPGRLLDHMQQGSVDLRSLEVLVLDEADHMFDMGFFPTIRQILSRLPKSRQTLFFSATMPPEVQSLATPNLRNPVMVQIGARAPVRTVAHCLYPVEQERKTELLLKVLAQTDSDSVVVFTRTKHRAQRLSRVLSEAGYKAAALQGNMSQFKRQSALDGFRSGKHQVLVATDLAARGLDVESITHVINFDIPNTVDAYTHRIGRTGRAERSGDAITFVTFEDEAMVRSIEKVLGSKIERKVMDGLTRAVVEPSAFPSRNQQRRAFKYQPRGGSWGGGRRSAGGARW